MTVLWIWGAVAVGLPVVARWARRWWGGRLAGPFHPLALLLFVSCLLLWILLAWEFAGPAAESPQPLWFWAICFAGLIWVETVLVLLPGRRPSVPVDSTDLDPMTSSPLEDAEDGGELSGEDPVELSTEAEALWQRISLFDTVQVHSIMTPEREVGTIGTEATAAEALAQMRETGRTRLVAIEGSLQRVLGIAHAKDLAPLLLSGRENETIRQHHRRLHRVPERLTLTRLVEQFRRNRTTAGIVIDLRGKTLGLITLGDVFHYVSGREVPPS